MSEGGREKKVREGGRGGKGERRRDEKEVGGGYTET